MQESWLKRNTFVLAGVSLSLVSFFVTSCLAKAKHSPPVGTYIGVMGLTAAIVSLFHLKKRGKFAWILFMTLLVVAEIRNLYVVDKEQANTFRKITDDLA